MRLPVLPPSNSAEVESVFTWLSPNCGVVCNGGVARVCGGVRGGAVPSGVVALLVIQKYMCGIPFGPPTDTAVASRDRYHMSRRRRGDHIVQCQQCMHILMSALSDTAVASLDR